MALPDTVFPLGRHAVYPSAHPSRGRLVFSFRYAQDLLDFRARHLNAQSIDDLEHLRVIRKPLFDFL